MLLYSYLIFMYYVNKRFNMKILARIRAFIKTYRSRFNNQRNLVIIVVTTFHKWDIVDFVTAVKKRTDFYILYEIINQNMRQ